MLWGGIVVNAMIVTKTVWTYVFAPEEGATAHLVPAMAGLVVVNAALLSFWLWSQRAAERQHAARDKPVSDESQRRAGG